jgi:hypothetical protein
MLQTVAGPDPVCSAFDALCELAHEAALPDTCLAADGDKRSLVTGGAFQAALERDELVVASHESPIGYGSSHL